MLRLQTQTAPVLRWTDEKWLKHQKRIFCWFEWCIFDSTIQPSWNHSADKPKQQAPGWGRAWPRHCPTWPWQRLTSPRMWQGEATGHPDGKALPSPMKLLWLIKIYVQWSEGWTPGPTSRCAQYSWNQQNLAERQTTQQGLSSTTREMESIWPPSPIPLLRTQTIAHCASVAKASLWG